MAIKINAGDVTRADLFYIDPDEIILDDKLNGRSEEHTEDAIAEIAYSLQKHGQQQPITVRRVKDNRIQVVAGYRRLKGARYLNANLSPEKPFRIQCRIVDCSDEEALARNVVENNDRVSTSVIDAAVNQRRFREGYGWTDEKIAELYHVNIKTVERITRLLQLPSKIQRLIHAKGLSQSAALDLLDLPTEKQEEILAAATNANGHISRKAVKTLTRAATGQTAKPTVSNMRKHYREYCGPGDAEPLRTFCTAFDEYLAGEMPQEKFDKLLDKLLK